jgi:hypothetical protein
LNITRTRVALGAAAAGGLLLACNAILGIEEATPRVDGDASPPVNDVIGEDRVTPGVDGAVDTGADVLVATDAGDAGSVDASDGAVVDGGDAGLTVTSIMAGTNGACAILSDTTAKCWGRWYWGLGDGVAPFESPVPTKLRWHDGVEISGILQLTEIRGGGLCVLRAVGNAGTRINCWGDNSDMQLGTNSNNLAEKAMPDRVVTDPGSGEVSATTSIADTCALQNDGRVLCWGPDREGQAGRGGPLSGVNSRSVGYIQTLDGGQLPPFRALWSVGSNTRFAATADAGHLYAWGFKSHVVTQGTSGARPDCPPGASGCGVALPFLPQPDAGQTLQAVVGSVALPRSELNPDGGGVQTQTHETRIVAVDSEGKYANWNINVPLTRDTSQTVVRVAGSGGTTCVINALGRVQCAGDGAAGKLGRKDTVNVSSAPLVVIDSAEMFVAIVAGPGFFCGLTSTNKDVLCWGDNRTGALGHSPGAGGSGDLQPDAGCRSSHDVPASINSPTFCNPVPSRIALP